MKEYESKQAFIDEIQKTAALYIKEFDDVREEDIHVRLEEGEKTPFENVAYQLGWMSLLKKWDSDEKAGKELELPAPGVKWNQMGVIHKQFYQAQEGKNLKELKEQFEKEVNLLCEWISTAFTEEALFAPGGRKWAQSTSSNWPVWKWVHINTVAPFKSFRTKIRKWKKEMAQR